MTPLNVSAHRSSRHRHRARAAGATLVAAVGAALAATASPVAAQERLLGLDISAWQGDISQATWNAFRNAENRRFVFLRASRGGTTGYYNQSNASNTNPPGQNTLSQRYDDPYYVQNITRATAAGLYAGSYHFSRPDIIESTLNSNGIRNSGSDEADHFIQMAGPWMRPGYLLPVHDLEAGINERTDTELAQFTLDFSNRIHQVMGIRPAIYINGAYAVAMQNAGGSLPQQVVAAYPTNWTARWPNQDNPNAIPVQSAHPKDSYTPIYGPWDDAPNPTHPWAFWQYTSRGRLQSFNNGGSNLDFDVAQGGEEFVKDHLVPAIWMNNSSGQWTTLGNWNSGQTPVAPVQGDGQVPRVGTLTLPTPRLPGAPGSGVSAGRNDTVILDRPGANITVTHGSGTTDIRKLYLRETLNVTGGSFTINYVPSPDSTPFSAQLSGNLTISGAGTGFSAHTVLVDPARSFNLNGGTVSFNRLDLMRGTTAAKVNIGGDVTFAPPGSAAANINSVDFGNSASMNLTAGARTLTVNDGPALVDLNVNVPIVNGTLTKSGPGTMRLGAANTLSGAVTVDRGILLVTGPDQLGSTGVITNQTVVTPGNGGSGYGGSLQLSGNVSYNLPITIGGGGNTGVQLAAPGSIGALDNLADHNTWAGTITLNGTGGGGSDPLENQIGALGGTLRLTGVIQNGEAGHDATWAKTGWGDVVLAGSSPNTYTGLTRLFGGRLILEKDGALGAAGASDAAAGNFFQNASSNSTLAFRAPDSSPGGFTYASFEVLNTEGVGAPGFAQVDNLGGSNTFAGAIAFGGPSVNGTVASSIGVSAGSLTVQGGLYARGTDGVRDISKTGAGTLTVAGSGAGAAPPNPLVVPLAGSTFNIVNGAVDLRADAADAQLLPGVTTWNVQSGALINSHGTLAGATVNTVSGTFTHAGGTVALAALNLPGGGAIVTPGGNKVLRTQALSITGAAAKVQLNDNHLIVDYSGATPGGAWDGGGYTGITGHVVAARSGGTWSGPSGIATAGADAISGLTTLGVAEASHVLGLSGEATATWNGEIVDASSVLVSYTFAGDANLDGKINVDDYGRIDSNVGSGATGWFNGDFNYDGKINIDDYGIIDGNVSNQSSLVFGAGTGVTASAAAEGVAAVPEPTALTILGIAALTLTARRRRHQPRA